jgi:ketopantoate hydroxymethyltransferase
MLLMSLGSGDGCDSQFLFSDDLLGDYDERIPRHARAYRNFFKEYHLAMIRKSKSGDGVVMKANHLPPEYNCGFLS